MVATDKVKPYGLAPEFERLMGQLAASKPRFWARIGREVDPRAIEQAAVRLIFEACHAIAGTSGQGPSNPVLVIQRLRQWQIAGRLTDADINPAKDLVLDAIEEAGTGALINEDQVIGELAAVIRARAERTALDTAIKTYGQQGDMGNVVRLFDRARRIGQADTTVGTRLDRAAVQGIRKLRELKRLPTGIDEVDSVLLGGPPRGTYNVLLGGTGDGKSMGLGHVFAHALTIGLSAAYCTLELAVELIVARIAANLTCIPSEEILTIDEAYAEAETRMAYLDQGGYLGFGTIKYMTPRVTTVMDLEGWLDEETTVHGVPIDLLVVDYGSLLGDPSKKVRHEELEKIAEDLRSLAIRRSMWVWTAAQINAGGLDKKKTKKVGVEHTAGSKGIPNTADTVIGLYLDQNEDMMRFNLAKFRGGKAGVEVGPVPADFEYGRIAPVSREGWPF